MSRRVRICAECGSENAPTAPVCGNAACKAVLVDPAVDMADLESPADAADSDTSFSADQPLDVIRLTPIAGGPSLVVHAGQVVGRSDIGDEQQPDVDVGDVLGRDTISRRHALLFTRNGRWAVRNLSRTNFTIVGERVISEYGTEVQITRGVPLGLANVMFDVAEADLP